MDTRCLRTQRRRSKRSGDLGQRAFLTAPGIRTLPPLVERDPQAVRPTLRCLSEFLASDLGADGTKARAARDAVAADPTHLLPWRLYELEHPVLEKARVIVKNEDALDPILSITDRQLWKVKIGPFRGAIWKDESGQWWLVGAGRRKDDGSGDFYNEEIDSLGGDSSSLVPDDLDIRYRRFEQAIDADLAAESEAQRRILSAILEAAAHRGASTEAVRVFGADITVRISADSEVDPAELTVEIEMVSYAEQDRIPHDVLALVPFFGDINNWDVMPAVQPGQKPIWWTMVPEAWIDWLRVAVELDDLLSEGWPAGSSPVPPEEARHVSHYAAGAVITLAYVEGVAIKALCGHEFTPSRDPDHFEVCTSCADALALLRRVRDAR